MHHLNRHTLLVALLTLSLSVAPRVSIACGCGPVQDGADASGCSAACCATTGAHSCCDRGPATDGTVCHVSGSADDCCTGCPTCEAQSPLETPFPSADRTTVDNHASAVSTTLLRIDDLAPDRSPAVLETALAAPVGPPARILFCVWRN